MPKHEGDRTLILQCDCHQGHYVQIDYFDWGEGGRDAYFCLTGDYEATQVGFWDRVKGALSVLMGWRWCWGEVILDCAKMAQLRAFLADLKPTEEQEQAPQPVHRGG